MAGKGVRRVSHHKRHHGIQRAGSLFFLSLRLSGFHLLHLRHDILHDQAHLRAGRQHTVDGIGGKPVRIHLMEQIADMAVDLRASRSAQIRDLVSCGVEHHAGMIVILLYHALHFRIHMLQEIQGIVVGVLMFGPHIRELIHDQHTILVAGIQHRLAHGMMGAPDTVKSGLLHLTAPALLRFGQSRGSDDAVVVVDTGSSEFYLFSVDAQAMLRIQLQPADPEVLVRLIQQLLAGVNLHLTLIEIGVVAVPELRVFDADSLNHFLLLLTEHGHNGGIFSHNLIVKGNRAYHIYLLSVSGEILHIHADLHHRRLRIHGRGGNPHAVRRDMDSRSNHQIDIPVDTAAGIPTAVGLHIVRDDHDLIVCAIVQIFVQNYIKIAVSVELSRRQILIDVNHGVGIDALKLQNRRLIFPLPGGEKRFLVGVNSAGPVACLGAVGRVRRPLLMHHRVMGKLHNDAVVLPAHQRSHQRGAALFKLPVRVPFFPDHTTFSFTFFCTLYYNEW